MEQRKLTRMERRSIAQMKASALRFMAEFKLKAEHLLEIFGMAIRAKMSEPSNRHNSIGSNYFNAHGTHHYVHATNHHPAGTKLVRAFIRHSRKEQTVYRRLYAELTGKQYNGVEA
jgi:hypothetical protein